MPPSADKAGRTVASLGEFVLIDRLARLVPSTGPGVILGMGDDTAVLRLSGDLLATCDTQIEGVHFTRDLCGPADIGWKALAVNLSDIAAMGGSPRYALISLALPPETEIDALDGIYAGLGQIASAYGVVVVGGNISRIAGPLVIDVTLLGEVQRPLTRAGAKPGDGVWVTGEVGKAAAGLYLLQHPQGTIEGGDALVRAYRRPSPRVEAGRALAADKSVTAAIDTSDGTASDLLHLAGASRVGVRLDSARLPLPRGLAATARAAGRDPSAWALAGGEDYEVLFTAAPEFDPATLVRAAGVPITRIGEVLEEAAGRWVADRGGNRTPLVSAGWDHFSAGIPGG
jgi:thiamine-monophosphate kinase